MPHSWWFLAESLPKVCWWHVCSFGLPWRCIGVLDILEWVTSLIAVYNGSEDDGQLPFMDVRVRKEENVFTTAVYRKPTIRACTRGGTVIVPSAKISLLFARLCTAQGRSALHSISMVKWRRCYRSLRRMATLDRLSAVILSRTWKASRCALVEKRTRCSYAFLGSAPSQLLSGIGSTGRQFMLFPTARRSALLRPSECSTSARKTYFQQKPWVTLVIFSAVHASRATLEGRHNAWKNASSSTTRRFRLPSLHVRCQFCVIRAVRRNL